MKSWRLQWTWNIALMVDRVKEYRTLWGYLFENCHLDDSEEDDSRKYIVH
jgi:hypothetical protein